MKKRICALLSALVLIAMLCTPVSAASLNPHTSDPFVGVGVIIALLVVAAIVMVVVVVTGKKGKGKGGSKAKPKTNPKKK